MNFVYYIDSSAKNSIGVTLVQLGAICTALTIQANRDYGRYRGGTHNVRAGSGPTDIVAGETVGTLVDLLPGAPIGAVADHDDAGGQPDIFVSLAMVNSISTGNNSLSVAMSHEMLETLGDPSINRRAYRGDGTGVAFELCDAVESNVYTINGIAVSDFLLDPFFDEAGSGPFTFIQATSPDGSSIVGYPSGPFQTAPGGYQVAYDTNGASTQVTSGTQRMTAPKREHWSSRAARHK